MDSLSQDFLVVERVSLVSSRCGCSSSGSSVLKSNAMEQPAAWRRSSLNQKIHSGEAYPTNSGSGEVDLQPIPSDGFPATFTNAAHQQHLRYSSGHVLSLDLLIEASLSWCLRPRVTAYSLPFLLFRSPFVCHKVKTLRKRQEGVQELVRTNGDLVCVLWIGERALTMAWVYVRKDKDGKMACNL